MRVLLQQLTAITKQQGDQCVTTGHAIIIHCLQVYLASPFCFLLGAHTASMQAVCRSVTVALQQNRCSSQASAAPHTCCQLLLDAQCKQRYESPAAHIHCPSLQENTSTLLMHYPLYADLCGWLSIMPSSSRHSCNCMTPDGAALHWLLSIHLHREPFALSKHGC